MNREQQRTPYGARRASGKSSTVLLAASAILLVLGLVAGGAWLYAMGMLAPRARLDRESFCQLGVPTVHSTFMFIDVTDPLNQAEIDRVKDRAGKIAASMEDYGLLTVAVLNPNDAMAPSIVFRRCAPPSPTRTSPILAGEQVLRAEWNKKFEAPLMAAIATATASEVKAERSPIMATIAALTQRADFDNSVQDRKLFVVSDLLEFNPKGGYSQMQGGDLVGSFRRSALAQAWPDLKGVPVTIQYVQRPEPQFARAQTPAHRSFWDWWLKTAGATRVEFIGVREPPLLPALIPPPTAKPDRAAHPQRSSFHNPCDCGG
jgi:hypothetical protein